MLHTLDESGIVVGAGDVPRRGRGAPRRCVAAAAIILASALVILSVPRPAHADLQGDPRDQPVVGFAVNQALELERSGTPIPWTNPETGRKGTIVLEPASYAQPDRPCRVYRRTIEQPGFTAAEVRGTGCRIGPALWTIDETIITAAVAVAPREPPTAEPAPVSVPAKVAPAKAAPSGKADRGKGDKAKSEGGTVVGDPAPPPGKPSLPAYTLPSKAGT